MTLCTGYVAAGKSGPSSNLIFKHLSVRLVRSREEAGESPQDGAAPCGPSRAGSFRGLHWGCEVCCSWC